MNNGMTLSAGQNKLFALLAQAATAARKPLSGLTSYYSSVLQRPLTQRQTLLLLNAQAAFLMTVLPASCPLLLRLACGFWLVRALLRCKEEL